MKTQQKTNPKKKKTNYSFFERIEQFLIFLLVTLLPTQFGKHFFLKSSYLSGVRVDYLAPTVYITDLLIVILLITHRKIIFSFFKQKMAVFILVSFLINLLFAISKELAFYRLLKVTEIILSFIVIKHIFSQIRNNNRLTALLFTAFTLGSFIQFVLVILQFINKHSLQGIFYFLGERYITLSTPGIAKASYQGAEILRPYGTFSHPNSMAGFYLLLYFFVLTYKSFYQYRYLKLFLLFISTVLILISFSKAVIIAFLLLNAFYFIKRSLKKGFCRLCFLARALIFFLIGFIFLSAKNDPLSLSKRIWLAQNAFSIIGSHLLTGVGLGNYLLAQDKFSIKYPYFSQQPVHNIFLLFIAETGLIISGLVFIRLLKLIRKKLRYEAFFFVFLSVFITGFFDHYWFTLQQNLLILTVVTSTLMKEKT